MYLISKHITRFNGFHSDIPLGYVETKEEAQECIDALNKASQTHIATNPAEIEQFLYKQIQKLDIKTQCHKH